MGPLSGLDGLVPATGGGPVPENFRRVPTVPTVPRHRGLYTESKKTKG